MSGVLGPPRSRETSAIAGALMTPHANRGQRPDGTRQRAGSERLVPLPAIAGVPTMTAAASWAALLAALRPWPPPSVSGQSMASWHARSRCGTTGSAGYRTGHVVVSPSAGGHRVLGLPAEEPGVEPGGVYGVGLVGVDQARHPGWVVLARAHDGRLQRHSSGISAAGQSRRTAPCDRGTGQHHSPPVPDQAMTSTSRAGRLSRSARRACDRLRHPWGDARRQRQQNWVYRARRPEYEGCQRSGAELFRRSGTFAHLDRMCSYSRDGVRARALRCRRILQGPVSMQPDLRT